MEEAPAQIIASYLVELIAALASSEVETLIQHASRVTWPHALQEQGVVKTELRQALAEQD
jgi:hypothetical protein